MAQHVDRDARLVTGEKFLHVQLIQRNESCTRHVRAGIFWRRADIQELVGLAGVEYSRECGGRDGS
jgi:hypothetical protein